jgi:undecaprenyl-diphosphatase
MIELDRTLFLFLNSLHSPFFDQVMWTVSLRTVWIPLYLFMIYLLIVRYRKRVWLPLLFVIPLIFITDQVPSLIKELTGRLRPCHDPSLQGLVHTVRGSCPGMYGFISGHASNAFGLASFTAPLLRRKWYTWSIFVWASLVSYSRIYLGVHYPGDILGGAILGLLTGAGLAFAVMKTEKHLK